VHGVSSALSRRRLTTAATALAVLFSGAAAVLAGPTAALADSSRVLSIKSVGDVVVDGVHQRVFISDPTGDKVVATTYDGTVVGSYAVNDPTSLVLSADSQQLYVALPLGHALLALDTSTLAVTAKYVTGRAAPYDVAIAGGKLWFTYDGNLGVVDPTAEAPEAVLNQVEGGWIDGVELASASADPTRLGLAGSGFESILDVSGDAPKVVATTGIYDSVTDLALSPDGNQIATVIPSDSGITVRDAADLGTAHQLPLVAYPNAVEFATDGTIAGGASSPAGGELNVFTPAGDPVREYDLPVTGSSTERDMLLDRALAWEPDGSRLFAVSANDAGTLSLRTYTEPKKSKPVFTLAGPTTATRAKALTVTGTLKSSIAIPAGSPVTVTRTDLDSPSGKALTTRTTTAAGAFSFTDTPPAGGTVTYKVSFAGDASHSAVSASKSITVSRTATTLTLTNNGKVYKYGTTVSFTAHLGKTYKSRVVEIWADPYGTDQGKRLVKRAAVNSKGDLSASVKLTRNTAVTASFTGDSRTATKSVKSVVSTKVSISLKLSKYYKTAKIGSTSYRYYHKKTDAVFTVKVNAHAGRSVYLQVQYYSGGKWKSWGEDYFPTSNGTAVVGLDGSTSVGQRLRVRASYLKNGSGDNLNATTSTAYSYLTFTK
jgi:hypothetical protein